MFDPEFYPCSKEAWQAMNADCYGKKVLDPSAGNGKLLRFAQDSGAESLEGIEKNEELRVLLSSKFACIGSDWFEATQEQISHVELILMNPPYSNADRHILHAWQIAPEGCEIIAQCNAETVKKSYYGRRPELLQLIDDYGNAEVVGQLYKKADRTTGVEVAIVRLFKPITATNPNFEGFYNDLEVGNEVSGVIRYNEIQAIVNTYTGAVKCFDKFEAIGKELNSITKTVGFGYGFSFKASYNDNEPTTKQAFAKSLQKHCWKIIFSRFKLEKYLTRGVMADVNKFVESRLNYPFTMKNIFRMVEIIVGTSGNNIERAIVEAVDNFTQHTHENRFQVEGWKTNAGHMLNKRFIVNYVAKMDSWDKMPRVQSHGYRIEYLEDLTKALCILSGKDYNSIEKIWRSGRNGSDEYDSNTWHEWGFFRFKVFKKGTGHFEFIDIDDWARLNQAYSKAKGNPLPAETWKGFKKRKSTQS